MNRAMQRSAAAVIVLASLLVTTARAAEAHGGPVVYSGESGPYRIEAYRSFGTMQGQRTLTYRLHVGERGTGRAVHGATVFVTARRHDEALDPIRAEQTGEDYQVRFALDGDEGWIMGIRVDGAPGQTSLTHVLPPPASRSQFVLMYGLPLLLLAAVWMAARIRRARAGRSGGTSMSSQSAR